MSGDWRFPYAKSKDPERSSKGEATRILVLSLRDASIFDAAWQSVSPDRLHPLQTLSTCTLFSGVSKGAAAKGLSRHKELSGKIIE